MNIQIFGTNKCFDTKKAQRWFKERRIKFQFVDLMKYGISKGELTSVIRSVKLDNIVNYDDEDAALLKYLANDTAKIEKLFEMQYLLKTPIVRNGKDATVGYHPEIWETWK